MQIDGDYLSEIVAPKPFSLENSKRQPITIDAETFEIEQPSNKSKLAVFTVESQQVNEARDNQQAQFVRLFSTESAPSSNEKQSAAQPLPKGVQQYLQIEQLNSNDGQPLLDERV